MDRVDQIMLWSNVCSHCVCNEACTCTYVYVVSSVHMYMYVGTCTLLYTCTCMYIYVYVPSFTVALHKQFSTILTILRANLSVKFHAESIVHGICCCMFWYNYYVHEHEIVVVYGVWYVCLQ